MAATVTNTVEIVTGQGAADGVAVSDIQRTRYFIVTLSAPDTNGGEIALSSGSLPQPGDAYNAVTASLVVIRRNAELAGKLGTIYKVNVSYGINTFAGGGGGVEPWNRDDVVGYGYIEHLYPLAVDFSATPKPVVNSVKDAFVPPIMVPRINTKATITRARKSSAFDYTTVEPLIGTVNDAAVVINGNTYAAGKCLMLGIRADPQTWVSSAGVATDYYNISIEVEISRQVDFLLRVINQGWRVKEYGSSRIIKAMDEVKVGNVYYPRPRSTQTILNSSGYALGDGVEPTEANGGILTFQPHASADWSALDL